MAVTHIISPSLPLLSCIDGRFSIGPSNQTKIRSHCSRIPLIRAYSSPFVRTCCQCQLLIDSPKNIRNAHCAHTKRPKTLSNEDDCSQESKAYTYILRSDETKKLCPFIQNIIIIENNKYLHVPRVAQYVKTKYVFRYILEKFIILIFLNN